MLGHTLEIVDLDMPNIEDIAKALRGLFRISRGEIARIAVMGGTDCAFIASFAHWVLNLKVHVEDEAGRIIYRDAPSDDAQVTVTYCRQAALSLVQISSTTFILRDDDWMLMRSQALHEANLTIRTPWDGCLTRVFGTTFAALIKAPTILGAFLGSTARIYQALALGESDVGPFLRKTYINFVETSYGIGFINSVVTIFPELKRVDGLFEEMQLGLDVPFREALKIVERNVLHLEVLCQCEKCTRGSTLTGCQVSLAFTIRELVSTLSCIAMDDGILPTVRGLDHTRGRQHSMWIAVSPGDGRPLLATALNLGMQGVYGEDATILKDFDRLAHPIEIFSGYSNHTRYVARPDQPHDSGEYCTAAVNQGLCYYLDCLRSVNSHAENARTVHIIPGHIQMDDRQFSHVYDISAGTTEPSAETAPVQFDILGDLESTSIKQQPRQFDIKMEMLGLEKARDHELIVYYRATIPGGPVIKLQPGRISKAVLKGNGILTCKRSHCTSRLVLPCALVRQGWLVAYECDLQTWAKSSTGPKCLIWPQSDDLARCVAIQLHMLKLKEDIVLRKNECISCCTVGVVHDSNHQNYCQLYHLM